MATSAGWLVTRIADGAPSTGKGARARTLVLVGVGIVALVRVQPGNDDAPGS